MFHVEKETIYLDSKPATTAHPVPFCWHSLNLLPALCPCCSPCVSPYLTRSTTHCLLGLFSELLRTDFVPYLLPLLQPLCVALPHPVQQEQGAAVRHWLPHLPTGQCGRGGGENRRKRGGLLYKRAALCPLSLRI